RVDATHCRAGRRRVGDRAGRPPRAPGPGRDVVGQGWGAGRGDGGGPREPHLPARRRDAGNVASNNRSGRALHAAACVVSAIPSHGTRDVIRRARGLLPPEATVVSATKGLEVETLLRVSEVIEDELGSDRPIAVLSGPSFAAELARGAPTAVAVAGNCEATVAAVQREFRSGYFRLYATQDLVGVEIGGAMKNVIAIAAGAVESLGLGDNCPSALITRGLAEISRLASALGGQRETLAGLSGLGDLVLTCTGQLSRNRSVGIELGKGRPLEEILGKMRAVAEGVRTTEAALALGGRHGVELPITAQMADVLAGQKTPRVAVEELMLRRQRSEVEVE
ncbi:Glycerol-3-phosphate dehydrogenase [NAD(P)+], partial [Geodia barretti]